MSQDAKTRALIDDAVARATAPLEARLEALEARVRALGAPGAPASAPEEKRAPAGRTAKARTVRGDEDATAGK